MNLARESEAEHFLTSRATTYIPSHGVSDELVFVRLLRFRVAVLERHPDSSSFLWNVQLQLHIPWLFLFAHGSHSSSLLVCVLLFEQCAELLKESSIKLLDSVRNDAMLSLGDSCCAEVSLLLDRT